MTEGFQILTLISIWLSILFSLVTLWGGVLFWLKHSKEIAKITGASHLSFASKDELEKILLLKQGSVTPLGIINDIENKVILVIEKELKDKKILVHPNTNTKTIAINYNDLIKFIEFRKHKYILM